MSEHTEDDIRDPDAEQQDPESGPASREEGSAGAERRGPDVENLDEDPAYEPPEGPLKDLKGG